MGKKVGWLAFGSLLYTTLLMVSVGTGLFNSGNLGERELRLGPSREPELRVPRGQPQPPGRARDEHRLHDDRGLLHGLHEAPAGGDVRRGEEGPVLALLPQLHAPGRRAHRCRARYQPDRALPLRGAHAHPFGVHGRPLRLHEQGEDRDHVLPLEPPGRLHLLRRDNPRLRREVARQLRDIRPRAHSSAAPSPTGPQG